MPGPPPFTSGVTATATVTADDIHGELATLNPNLGTATIPAPVVTTDNVGDETVNLGAVTAAAAVTPASVATTRAVLTPNLGTVTVPAPATVGQGTTVTPTAVNTTGAVPAPTGVGVSAGDYTVIVGDILDDVLHDYLTNIPHARTTIPQPLVGLTVGVATVAATGMVPNPTVQSANNHATVAPVPVATVGTVPTPGIGISVTVTQLAAIRVGHVADATDTTWVRSGVGQQSKLRLKLDNIGSFTSGDVLWRFRYVTSPSDTIIGLYQNDTLIGSLTQTPAVSASFTTDSQTLTNLGTITDFGQLELRVGNNGNGNPVDVADVWLDTNLGIIRPVDVVGNEARYWSMPSTPPMVGAVSSPSVSVDVDSVVTPATVTCVGVLPGPGVSSTNNTTQVNVSPVPSVATIPAPTVDAGTGAAPSVAPVVAAATVGAHSVSTDNNATRTPVSVAAIGSVSSVDLQGNATRTPPSVTVTGGIASPGVTGSATVTPATIATLVNVPRPAVASRVFAGDINVLSSVPSVAVTLGADREPVAVTGVVSFGVIDLDADPSWTHFYTDRAGVPA